MALLSVPNPCTADLNSLQSSSGLKFELNVVGHLFIST
jgi:hypothetical protein